MFGLAISSIERANIYRSAVDSGVLPRSRAAVMYRTSPAAPKMAAYLASMAAPNAAPASIAARRDPSRPLTAPTSASRPSDQKSSIGVSVDITKLPTATAGRLAQRSAAQRPALSPASQKPARHSTSAVARWIQGAGSRTAQT